MKKFSLALLAVAAALAITPAALADTFNFTFKVGGITATGTLTGTEIGNSGQWFITSGTINIVGGDAVGSGTLGPALNGPGNLYTYQNPPNSGGANYTIDDLFTPGSNQHLDDYGLYFTVDGIPVNIWGDGPNNYEIFEGAWLLDESGGSFVAPEPSSLLLLGTGLIGLALLAFRKRKPSGLVLHA